MAEPRNIQIFQQLAGRTLARLYSEFPNPTLLDARPIGQEVADLLDSPDEERERVITRDCASAVNFLVREQFITFRPDRRYLEQPESVFPDALLTLKGFNLLGAVPAAVDEKVERRPIGEQLSDALNDGARATVSDIVKSLFIGAVAFSAKTLGE